MSRAVSESARPTSAVAAGLAPGSPPRLRSTLVARLCRLRRSAQAHPPSGFCAKLLTLLRDRGLISQERIDLLLSWRHSGFSVHNRTTVYPSDTEGLHKLSCYLMRAPVNLSRLRFDSDSGLLVYEPKPGHELDDDALTDPFEFLARVLTHIPEPNKHLVHFYGVYANRIRRTFRERIPPEDESTPAPSRRAVNKRWAELIYRIYEVDPLTCSQCRPDENSRLHHRPRRHPEDPRPSR